MLNSLNQCSRCVGFCSTGMTAVGGMLLLAHGNSESSDLIPDSPSHWMGAIATVLSFVNICGGFLITGKMLDLFRSVHVVWHMVQFDDSVDMWLCVGLLSWGYFTSIFVFICLLF